MLHLPFSSHYLDVLCSKDFFDFTFIGEITCNANFWCKNNNILNFRNINSIDEKIAKNALRLMETASVAHPCALSDIEATVPYKENSCVYLFSVKSPIRLLQSFRTTPVIICTLTQNATHKCLVASAIDACAKIQGIQRYMHIKRYFWTLTQAAERNMPSCICASPLMANSSHLNVSKKTPWTTPSSFFTLPQHTEDNMFRYICVCTLMIILSHLNDYSSRYGQPESPSVLWHKALSTICLVAPVIGAH